MAMAVGSDRDEALVEAFHELTNNQHVEPTTIPVQMGRKLQVDKAGASSKFVRQMYPAQLKSRSY
jgi:hypothetical protein